MSCCSQKKNEGKNVEKMSNEENIDEIRHGRHEGGQSEKTNSPVNPRTFGHESNNAARNAKQSTEERTH